MGVQKFNLNLGQAYKRRAMAELRLILPKWAYGQNVDKLLDHIQNPINNEYTIFKVDTIELIMNAELNEINPNILFTGESNNDYRIARILYRWENDYFVDPPCIGISSLGEKKIAFSDGRHRTKLCYILGHRQIPVAIDNFQIQNIHSIIKLTSV